MNGEELIRHREALDLASKDFDEERQLMLFHTKKDAYHTKLADKNVHAIRESITYANALLYGGRPDDILRADGIIKKVVGLQDKDPKSDTFGLWSYYEEEPLDRMDAPDRNWADFIGKELLEIIICHKDKIDKDLVVPVKNACRYACESILRRDEGVQYTNVAFTDTLVTIGTGELLGEERLIRYGKDKLERFLAFERTNGGVFEFNSPCYTPLVTRDAAAFLKLIKDPEARAYAEKINYMAWKMIAEHFRADILQLAGPQSRAYSDYLSDELMYQIELACDGNVEFDCDKKVTVETFWTKSSCPPEFYEYFKGEKLPESTEKIIMKGFNYPFFAFSQVASTYHDDKFVLGTYNREELWNQRRPLIAYIKSENGKPYCLRLRCLHDGYDFSSAQLHCVQEKGSVLGVVNFSSNRGDTHIGLDGAKDAQYKELCVSFELEGDMKNVSVEEDEKRTEFSVNGTKVSINILNAKFGENKISYNINKSDNKLCYTIVLYSGEKTKIDLEKLEAAYVSFALDINEDFCKASSAEEGDYIVASRTAGGKELRLETFKKVMPFMNMMYDDRQYKDGVLLEKMSEQNRIWS